MKEELKGTSYRGPLSKFSDSPWLSSIDIIGLGDIPVEILDVKEFRNVKAQEGKITDSVLALCIKGHDKMIWLNKTNQKRLARAFGKIDEWIGKKCILYVEDVKNKKTGEMETGIRIRVPEGMATRSQAAVAAAIGTKPNTQ